MFEFNEAMNILPKYFFRSAVFGVPILILAIAGCNRSTTANKTAVPTRPIQYTQIDAATAGTVSGTIHFTGTAPAPIAIDMAQDPACADLKRQNMTEQIVVHHHRMANVFVYVRDGLGNRVYMPTKLPAVLDQKDCRFTPHVIGAMIGQPVEFRNSDPTMHNVHIIPPDAQDPGGFNTSQMRPGSTQRHIFRTTGTMIPIRCDYHPWMEAFLNVVKNPFFAVSNGDGRFEIKGLPPGQYTLVADQEKLGSQTQSVTVESRKTTAVNFTFTR